MNSAKPVNSSRLQRLNTNLLVLRQFNQLIVSESDPTLLIRKACKLLVETDGLVNAWIVLFDRKGNYRSVARAGVGKQFSILHGLLRAGEWNFCVKKAMKQRRAVTIKEPLTQCADCPLRSNYTGRCGMAVRLQHQDRILGSLTVSLQIDVFSDKEGHELLQEVSDGLAFALHNLELLAERDQAHQALELSENRFRTFFHNSPDYCYQLSPTGKLLDINNAACRVLGYRAEELLGKKVTELVYSPDSRQKAGRLFRQWRETGVLQNEELTIVTRTGDLRQVLLSVEAVRDEQGRILYSISHQRDITEHKEAEEALRENQRQLVTLLSNLPGMAYRCLNDPDWTMEFVSAGAVALTGYRPEELVDNTRLAYADLIHPDDRQQVWETVQQVVSKTRPFQIVYRIFTATGELKWVWEQGRGIIDKKGELLALEGFITDITSLKQTEYELKMSETDYRALFEHAPVPLWEEDLSEVKAIIDGLKRRRVKDFRKYLERNPAVVDDCIRRVRILDLNDHVLELYEADSKAELLAGLPQLFTDESVIAFREELIAIAEERPESSFDSVIKTMKGNRRVINLRWSMAPGFEESLARIFVSTTDITERKEGEASLQQSERRLIEAQQIARMGDFTWDVSSGEITWSDGLFDLLGYDKTELIDYTKVNTDIHHPDDLERVTDWLNDCVSSGKTELTPNEYRLKRKDGDTIVVRTVGVIERSADKSVNVFATIQDITDRKRVENEIKAHASFLDSIMESSPFAMWISDHRGTIVRTNRTLRDTLALPDEDISGKYNVLHDDNLTEQGVMPRVEAVFSDLQPARFVIPWIAAKAGDKTFSKANDLWIDVSMFPIVGDEGKLKNVVCQWVDITERIQAERSLEQRFREITALNTLAEQVNQVFSSKEVVEASLDNIAGLIDPDLTLIFLRYGEKLLIQGERYKGPEFKHEETPEHRVGECLCGIAVSEQMVLYSRNIHKDPRCSWTECKKAGLISFAAFPLYNRGEIIGVLGVASATERDFEELAAFLETAANEIAIGLQNALLFEELQDHTARLEQEIAERREVEAELRESEEKYSQLFESMSEGFALHEIITNEDGQPCDFRFLEMNPACERLTGMPRAEMIGRRVLEITSEPPWIEHYGRVALTGEPEHFQDYSTTLEKWFEVSAYQPRPGQCAALFNDITERKQAEAELHKYQHQLEALVEDRTAELQAANQELESFAYSVSHDLRAPLRHISGYIDLLGHRFPEALPEKGKHYLDSIVDSTHRMGLLIDDLLKFSRTGRQELQKITLDLNVIVQSALESLEPDTEGRSIEWTIALLPQVSGDQALMKLVWINLLSNAIKFSRKTEHTKIEIGYSEQEKELLFFVRDNGVGFDMRYAQKLFGVFQRFHSSEEFEGTGIGLANVQRIIMRHGGRTWAEAEPDKGATFFFTMPK